MYNNVGDQTRCAGLCTFSSWIGSNCVQQCMRRFNIVFRCIRRSCFTGRKSTGGRELERGGSTVLYGTSKSTACYKAEDVTCCRLLKHVNLSRRGYTCMPFPNMTVGQMIKENKNLLARPHGSTWLET